MSQSQAVGERAQLLAFAGLAVGGSLLAAVAFAIDASSLRHLAVGVHPLLVSATVGLVGLVAMRALVRSAPCVVIGKNLGDGFRRAGALAAVFGVVVILADLAFVFPAGMNAPFLQSLVAAPAIALVVEVVFHLVPVTGLAVALGPEKLQWWRLALVALLEPTYQVLTALDQLSASALTFVAVHVALINVSQLWLFRRHGFVCMYALRVAYYLLWHVAWGHFRLQVLF